MGKFMTHGLIILAATLTAALAVSGANPVESGAAEQAGSGRLSEVAAPEGPSNATQFNALHQTKVREYFSNHKAALVPPVEADNASIKVGVPVPESVHLFPLPDTIFTDMPTTPVYLYFRWGKAVVVANVDTRVVVSIIPDVS
jgi:Protein of unknown function (DUF1236)